MLETNNLNWLAIVVAWIINVAVGGFWYSPAGFGKLWSKLSGVDMMQMPKDAANKAIAFVGLGALIQTFALAIILKSLDTSTLTEAIVAGLVLWAGFTAATTIGNNLYSRLSWKFWWLNSSFFLIVMIVNSILLTKWQ